MGSEPLMYLIADRLIIRPFRHADVKDIFAYCCQEDVGPHAGWKPICSEQETAAALCGWIAEGHRHALELKSAGRVIGHISINPDSEEGRSDTRELGAALNDDFHHQGYMSEAIQAVLNQLFGKENEVKIIWACCFKDNVDSRKMIERNGFHYMQDGLFHSISLNQDFPSREYRITRQEWLNQ